MIAIYPGSFDPPTVGHLEIIRRAARLCDKLFVCVMVNPEKRLMFSAGERAEMIEICAQGITNVVVHTTDAGLMQTVKALGADAIVRGLRSEADYQSERPVADAFLRLGEIETLFIQCSPEHGYVSSSLVREMMGLGLTIDKLVPEPILGRATAERSE